MSKILRYAKYAEVATVDLDAALPSPQITLDIASATLDVPSDTQAIWEGGIGRGPRLHRPGYYALDGNTVQAADVHTLAWFLKWALGGYEFTADGGGEIPNSEPAADFNLHEMWGATDTVLPPFVTWLGKDLFEHVVRGCIASQLQLQVSDGYMEVTLDVIGAKDAKGTLDEAVLEQLPLVPPLTFPHVRFWVGGTDPGDERSKDIQDLQITINNNGDADGGRGLGSRFARREIPAGQRDTTLQYTSWYDSTDDIERVWGQASGPSDDGSTELPLRIVADSGADGSVTIDLPRVLFTQVQTQPSGRSRIDQQVQATALLDTVELSDSTEHESEILVAVENTEAELEAAS